MTLDIHPKGSPNSQVWVLVEFPYQQDKDKRFLFSDSYGYVWDKMMRSAGITDYYVIARRADLDDKFSFSIIENELDFYKPPIIITIEEAGKFLCDELNKKKVKKSAAEEENEIEKYAGSLLQSPKINYPHYVIPTYAPDTVCKDWSLRDIVVSLDLGKAKDELEFYKKNGYLNPLPIRELKYDIKDYNELSLYLDRFEKAILLANDIETVYTNKKSMYYPHPGQIITVGLADSPEFGISFNLFREDKAESIDLWKRLFLLFSKKKHIGQNFFNFDLFRYEALGFNIPTENIYDTLIRHHVLWPELPHKLQFLTRQYTRQPYYKDEGKQWNMRDMRSLRRYNCLDVCVDFEVYLKQEEEFNERPWLR